MKTNNASIIRDIVRGALSMPVKSGSKLVPTICQAAKNNLLQLCFDDVSDLCVTLAEGGEILSAELLAQTLFVPRLGTNKRNQWDEHQYKEGLEKVVPTLAKRMGSNKFLIKLCDWLQIFIETKERCDPATGSDYSHLWRPAIEDHGENQDYHFAGPMVGFVRQGFEQAIENERITLENAIKIIDQYKYLVFKRIKIHLINKFAEKNPALARKTIMNHDLFENFEYKHEYAMLAGQRLTLLTGTELSEWFTWIEKRPNASELRDLGINATEEQRQAQIRYWKYNKLYWVRVHLEGSRKEIYDSMRSEFGEPEMADLNIRSRSWGNESPIRVEDLSKLTFEEAVKKVSEWRPNKPSFMGPSIDGLSSSFQEYVATQPKIFSEQALVLLEHPAIYVRKFITHMAQEIKSGNDLDINAILKLCAWVLSRPIEECTTPAQEEVGFIDKDWTWTRNEIALFIRNICQAVDKNLPKYSLNEFRDSLWGMIDALCYEPCESINHKVAENDVRSEDYYEIGINSSRGKAMEAALEYARWVFSHHKFLENNLSNFEALPEVKNLIESRLIAEDRTPGELALIGSNINLIYSIDKHWLKANAHKIFPLDSSSESSPKAIEWAAWNAFLFGSQPHIEFYKLFKNQFVYAIEQSSFVSHSKSSSYNPIYRLGEHLIILYIRGETSLEEENGSLRNFLSDSKLETRRHTIEFVRRLLDCHETISIDVMARCERLWEMYWLDKGLEDAQKTPSTWPFEVWFSSGKFSTEWSMEQLEKYLEAAEAPEISNQTVEELANIAESDISRAINILDKIIQCDKESWRIPGWQDSIYTILKKALEADEKCKQAQQLINYLGRCGYMKFGSLVS